MARVVFLKQPMGREERCDLRETVDSTDHRRHNWTSSLSSFLHVEDLDPFRIDWLTMTAMTTRQYHDQDR